MPVCVLNVFEFSIYVSVCLCLYLSVSLSVSVSLSLVYFVTLGHQDDPYDENITLMVDFNV